MKNILTVLVVLVVIVAGAFVLWSKESGVYNPSIEPDAFTADITNPYFTLVPGTRFTYEAKKKEGTERIEVTVLSETRIVMGVETRVVRDQVFLNGSLIEDTLDWYAQDNEGNVWYFGEDTAEYENGVITSHHGAWEAGVDGALPGIVMKAVPKVGDTYRQEYFVTVAEDMADVLSVTENVTVPSGTYANCLKTFDHTPLDPKSLEHKYYCKEVGFTSLEIDLTDNERTELIKIEKGVVEPSDSLTPSASAPTTPAEQKVKEGPTPDGSPANPAPAATSGGGAKVSEAQAKEIALSRVPGIVTAISVEAPFDKPLYVVEVKPAEGGAEVDITIDVQTGAVLSVEE